LLSKERILGKIDELDSYIKEIGMICPKNFNEYKNSVEKKRACERLLHISIECVIDICGIIAVDKRIGLPSGEEDMFKRLEDSKILSERIAKRLRAMRGFRNILVHRYGSVDDKLVYKVLKRNMRDFGDFKLEILNLIRKEEGSRAG